MALAENRRARFDYEILKRFEAGMELTGAEAKSIRAGKISLAGAFIGVRGPAHRPEAYLLGSEIQPYQPNNLAGKASAQYDATRARKLLLTKAEIAELAEAEAEKGLTIVPLSVYNKNGLLKLELAIARGKKRFDKREVIRKRETERELKREL